MHKVHEDVRMHKVHEDAEGFTRMHVCLQSADVKLGHS